jgi:hypothetical protein
MSANEFNPASMIKVEGFITRYFQNLKKCKTNEEAYQATAEEYRKAFGHDKYSGYESFKKVKNRKLKSN